MITEGKMFRGELLQVLDSHGLEELEVHPKDNCGAKATIYPVRPATTYVGKRTSADA